MKCASWTLRRRSTGVLAACGVFLSMTTFWFPTNQDGVELALRQLRSEDARVRLGAKQKLIELGNAAVSSLVSKLEDLVQRPRPTFEWGKEAEGEQASIQRVNSIEAGEKGIIVAGPPDIYWRLVEDLVDLLGRLKAPQAIPVLLEAMKWDEMRTLGEQMRPEMKALLEIGEAAVPQLCEAFATAEPDEASVLKYGSQDMTIEQRRRALEGRAHCYQARLAMVLSEIGSIRALPVLEDSFQSDAQAGRRTCATLHVEQAIDKIKFKQGMRSR